MKIAVVGCGAMGSIYAALFASAGNEVFAVDANEAHVQAINEKGLRLSGVSGDRTVRIEAFSEAPQKTADLIIVAVKATHVPSAITNILALLEADSIVLAIQNGLGSAEQLAAALGKRGLLIGVAQGFGASLPAPGVAHHNDMKAIKIGSLTVGGVKQAESGKAEKISGLWRQAGFNASAERDIARIQWEKLICNVAYSAPCAIAGMTVGEVLNDQFVGPISRAAAQEAWQVARACGIEPSFDDPAQEVRDFAVRMPGAKPSVVLDIEAGQESEIEFINGAVPREAAKIGMTAPVNETLTRLVRSIESRR